MTTVTRGVLTTMVLGFGALLFATQLFAAEGDLVAEGAKLWKVVDGALEEAGKLVFSDTFEDGLSDQWKLDGAHVWRVQDGALVTTGYGGFASLKIPPGDDFVLLARVKPIAAEPAKAGGFAGVHASGIMFLQQPGRWWWQYRKKGEERSRGKWKEEAIPLKQWREYRIVCRAGGIAEWFVDGRKLCDILEPGLKGSVNLHAWRIKVAYDDIRVYRIFPDPKAGPSSPRHLNLVRNSSFEDFHDNLPPYWIPRLRDIPFTYGTMEHFHESWRLDTEEKYHGGRSFRMGGNKVNSLTSTYCSVEKGKPYTFSAHLRSDAENMPVDLIMPGATKRFEVGQAWKRYAVTLEQAKSSRIRLCVRPKTEAALWVDAIALEAGTSAGAYQPNPLDGRKATVEERPAVPASRIAKATRSPSIDGALSDACWTDATRTPPLRIPRRESGGTKVPSERTEAFVCHDADNLYLAFKCHDSRMAELRAKTTEPDSAAVAGDDCLEIFLDSNRDRKTFLRFVVNAAGTTFDGKGSNDLSWNTDWSARTVVGKTSWTAEITIPLASLELSPLVGRTWGLNLCRGNPKAGEYSCTAPVPGNGMYFHDVANYGLFEWENPAVFARHTFSLNDLRLLSGEGETCVLSGTLGGVTDGVGEVVVQAKVGGHAPSSTSVPVGRDRSRAFSIAGLPAPKTEEVLVSLAIVDRATGDPLYRTQKRAAPTPMITAVSDRNYYTTEDHAAIQVTLALSDEVLRGTVLRCEARQLDQLIRSTKHEVRSKSTAIAIPLADLPVGASHVSLAVLDRNGKEVATTAESLHKLPPGKSEVKIDRVRRILLVEGKPFFPFAPLQVFHVPSGHPYGGCDDHIATMMAYWHAHGFKALIVGANVDEEKGQWGKRIWDTVFKEAARNDLKIIVFWTGPSETTTTNEAKLSELILRWKDEPALLAWMPIDEPAIKPGKPEDVATSIAWAKRLDPYHPVYINYTQMGPTSRYAGLPGDIMSLDYYLTSVEGRTVQDTLKYVDLMEEISRPRHIPTWNFIVGSNLDNHTREISAGEQVAQTYGNIIKGATGLKYFFGQLAGREHWQAFKQLNREVIELTPVILAADTTRTISSSRPAVLATTRTVGGKAYVLSVNIENQTSEVAFDISALSCPDQSEIKVLFEGRTLVIHDNILRDTFSGFQRHVYELAPGAAR